MNAYLILCHQPPLHLLTWAARHPNVQFYVHYDAKSPLIKLDSLKKLSNVHIIRHRIAVNWGGFSMIEATLALMQAALSNKKNQYFHLISGDCMPLVSPEQLAQQCAALPKNSICLISQNAPHFRYRTRFNAPHADTNWQRSLFGKILTQGLKILDKILKTDEICLAGSQWFSANRGALEILFCESLGEAAAKFEKKLVPDEHFFQYIVAQNLEKFHLINDNHRFIRFSESDNHPDFLTLDNLWVAQKTGAWFARKVAPELMTRWLEYEKQV